MPYRRSRPLKVLPFHIVEGVLSPMILSPNTSLFIRRYKVISLATISVLAADDRRSCQAREPFLLIATGYRTTSGQAVATGKTGLCRYRNENVLTFCPRKDFCLSVGATYIYSSSDRRTRIRQQKLPKQPVSSKGTSCLVCS